jgi:hypothetical protein
MAVLVDDLRDVLPAWRLNILDFYQARGSEALWRLKFCGRSLSKEVRFDSGCKIEFVVVIAGSYFVALYDPLKLSR